MTFPPPHPAAQNSVALNTTNSSGARPVRGQQSAWGQPPGPTSRTGLTPLSTSLGSSFLDFTRSTKPSTPSPITSSFSSGLISSTQNESIRSSHASISTSPFGLHSGSQQLQPAHLLLSPRSRGNTPTSNTHSASSAASSTTASQGGGGSSGGGGATRINTFSPPLPQHGLNSPTSSTFDRSGFGGLAPSTAISGRSSLSKYTVTQISILLSTMPEKESKAKWDSKAAEIQKLVESNGMEVFIPYFRKLLLGSSSQIFPGINRPVENSGNNYHMLVQEVGKVVHEPHQASKIAETIDSSDGDIFRDFDLSAFMDNFELDALAKTLLASAFMHVSRQDLRTKAGAILSSNSTALVEVLENAHNDDQDREPSLIAMCAFKFLADLPPALSADNELDRVRQALYHRYAKRNLAFPSEIRSALLLLDLLEVDNGPLRELLLRGPEVTTTLDNAKSFVSQHCHESPDERQVGRALLFMVLSPDAQNYKLGIFVSAVHERVGGSFDWQLVVREFDIKGLEISKHQFLTIFAALLPVAKEHPQFDIQILWGGQWQNPDTKFSFVSAFLSSSPVELDATTIPDLRQAYDPRESLELDGPDDVATYVEDALHDTTISLDAITTTMDILAREDLHPDAEPYLTEILGEKMHLFLCSLIGVPKPWSMGQQHLMRRMLEIFLNKEQQGSSYVLKTLWKHDKQFVAMTLVHTHLQDPLELTMILDLARDYRWMEDLCTLTNGFGIDLAALASRKGYLDIDQWTEDKTLPGPNGLVIGVQKFLVLKAEDELRTAREEQPEPRTVSLAMKTVYNMLAFLDRHMTEKGELKTLQRQCLQAFPRLIIFCEDMDAKVDVDCKESNKLPREADTEMQDLYKRMYSLQLSVPNILEYLKECKASDDSARVDLFACMIHGLFDEFSCFNEYPLAPLATTAVLFGGIMQVHLISDLTLRVGQEMVLDSVHDYPPEASMYKFGLQALIHVTHRFREPEWSDYCTKLIKIPQLKDTEAYKAAASALSTNDVHISDSAANGVNGDMDEMEFANRAFDDYPDHRSHAQFKSVNADAQAVYDEPDEETEEKVVFFFNNVSEQNLNNKLDQLQEALQGKYYHWFASFLVEKRAKVEPNYQPLYLDMLRLIGNEDLWNEVVRETYVSVQKLLNADSTLSNPSERKNLKSLSVWLGSLTLARNKPIKHKKISFVDLLIEGLETQKLIIVIPFTCNVLAQGNKSLVFRPPNPWLLEVIAVLVELYQYFDLKLNQKFEIEVLCGDLNLPHPNLADPSSCIRGRPSQVEDLANEMLPDGPDNFENTPLGGINRSVRNPRFDLEAMSATLPDLEALLVFPPSSGSAANQVRLRKIVQEAVKKAILEIIAPVVERSVTIATIATSSLIRKDFAREPDDDRVRKSAQQMVRQLSGSLALVTCKEPLKMSMTNYIRVAQADFPEQAFPEGAILMCVNDNLDTACGIVEKQAEERSMPEIETHIEEEIAQRQQHRLEHPTEPYVDPNYNRWATFIPDPYRQSSGGLNSEQMAIYLEFARQSRGPANHTQTSSADSGRQQLPDVLQDAYSSMPHVHTTAESMGISHQAPQQQQQHLGRMLPPPLPASLPQSQTNGYLDPRSLRERVQELLHEMQRVIKESEEDSMIEGVLGNLFEETFDLADSSPQLAMDCAEDICKTLYSEDEDLSLLEAQAFAKLLSKLCEEHLGVNHAVSGWVDIQHDEKMLLTAVTIALLQFQIFHVKRVDAVLARLISDHIEPAIGSLSSAMDTLLLNRYPSVLRADFASSIEALGEWYLVEPHNPIVKDLIQRLNDWELSEAIETTPDDKSLARKHQLQYVFKEWLALCESYPMATSEKVFAAFISQLHMKQLINSQEDMALFLRVCIDESIHSHESLKSYDTNEPFTKIDSLARLVVLMVRNQGEVNGAVKGNKAAYMESVLALITLLINHYHVTQGEQFNQRMFFRLSSTILCDWHEFGREGVTQDRDMLLVFASAFLQLTPRRFPAFIYSWLSLISHRIFMPSLLKLPNGDGWASFASIMEAALAYVCQFLKPRMVTPLAAHLYQALLRISLILHHDFPEFLAENHFRLCNAVPAHCTQLHNLILSAFPSSFPELPNPFYNGLKIDRLEEIRQAPRISADYISPLVQADIKEVLDACLRGNEIPNDIISRLSDVLYIPNNNGLTVNSTLLHAIVLYIGQSAIAAAGPNSNGPFIKSSPHASLIIRLATDFQPDARYFFLSAIAHQLRYPSNHLHYFSAALLELFRADVPDVREQIVRVLLQRMHVVKPHPWGLVITMLELLKNQTFNFFDSPFLVSSPGIKAMCEELKNQMDDRVNGQFTQNI